MDEKHSKKWDDLDLFLYKARWSNRKYKNYFESRLITIHEIVEILNREKIIYNLSAQTDNSGKIVFDKRRNDLIYINKKDISKKNLINLLGEQGFTLVKEDEVTKFFEKNNIVIEVQLKNQLNKGRNKAKFSYKFKNLDINNDLDFTIKNQKKYENRLKKILNRFKKIYYVAKILGLKEIIKFSDEKIYKLSYKSFLKLSLESKKSINWELRKEHLNIITKNKKNLKINKIINSFKNEPSFLDYIHEVDTSETFDEPIHLNRKFWEGGNNFFYYPLIFGFRKNVIAYKEANSYIASNPKFNLYSYDYYASLEKMEDEEIKLFLENNPIEIKEDYITSGKHRVAAMIGRLEREEGYINFYTKIK